ncbi:hypothetical protein FA95DRAFT_652253 [Auriscalpium vulgare]|uniref:Uncharacterized protein n=1 Tax=Auriscalpium vulgare TaxID=40419 RepID=A0ACB8RDV9_9AGAM|nr:hypothetical protein FA95DRAFT_652253 [Auriscalpium vulgare]
MKGGCRRGRTKSRREPRGLGRAMSRAVALTARVLPSQAQMNPPFLAATPVGAAPTAPPSSYQSMAFHLPNPQLFPNPFYLSSLQINSMQTPQPQQQQQPPQAQLPIQIPMQPQAQPHTQMQPDANQARYAAALADPFVQAWVQGKVIADIYGVSSPVGSQANDKFLLVHTLHACKSNKRTYKEALDGLHGTNGHASNLWKDYYLDHKFEIDDEVSRLGDAPQKTVKKPSYHLDNARASSSSQRAYNEEHMPKKERTRESASASAPLPSRRVSFDVSPHTSRRTMNSQSVPIIDTSIPPVPKRKPVPPTKVVPGVRGNQYTKEDREFFIDFVNWELYCDSSLSKTVLLDRLAQKVPHHSKGSWQSHWNRVPVIDKIMARAKGEVDVGRAQELSEDDDAYEEEEEEVAEDDDDADEEAQNGHASDDDFQASVQGSDDASQEGMGEGGSAFTKADYRAMAKWIAQNQMWSEMSSKQRWYPFYEEHPQRSMSAWAERYRKSERELLRKAKKYRRREQITRTQHGRPSWADEDERRTKRRRSTDQ